MQILTSDFDIVSRINSFACIIEKYANAIVIWFWFFSVRKLVFPENGHLAMLLALTQTRSLFRQFGKETSFY